MINIGANACCTQGFMNQNSRIEELVGDSVLVFSGHTKKNQFSGFAVPQKGFSEVRDLAKKLSSETKNCS